MTKDTSGMTLAKAAKIAGFGLLGMTIFAVFAEFFIRQKLLVPGDVPTTASNIMANELTFRLGILSFVIVIVLDVVVAWALYILLKPVNGQLSRLTAWFRLVYSAIFAIAVANLFNVLELLGNAAYLKAFEQKQLHAQMMLSLDAFSATWMVGLVFFGTHLALLGYLAFKSGYIPKILGVLLVIAGLGYIADSVGIFLFSNYVATIALVTFIGEALFMLWLLVRGFKIPEPKS